MDNCGGDRRLDKKFGLMYEGYFGPSADTLQMPGLNKNFSELRAPTNGSEKVNDPSHNSCSFSGNEGEAGSKNLSESRAPTKGSEKMDDSSCISCSFPGYFEPSADTLLMPGLNQNLSDSRAPTKGSEKVDDSSEQQELVGNSGERNGNSCSMSGNEDEEGSKIVGLFQEVRSTHVRAPTMITTTVQMPGLNKNLSEMRAPNE